MSANELSGSLQKKIIKVYRETGSKQETADRLGLHRGTVMKYLKRLKIANAKPKREPVDPVEDAKQKEKAKQERRQYVESLREHAFRSVLTKAIRESVTPIPAQPKRKPWHHSPGTLVRHPMLALNDWHFEENVKPDGILGLNEYSINIACNRVWRVINAVIDWKKDAENGGLVRYPKITVPLLGDFITGTLHGLERHSDARNVVHSAVMCGDLIAMAIADLAKHFEEVEVIGVVGNHGRLPDAKKVPTKDPTRSWDYLAYEVARRRLWNQSNVTWHLPEAYGCLFEVGGHLCYGAHGNFIPNNLGVVGYGIRRFTSSLASNLQAAGKPLRYAFFGHWHSANSSEFSGVEAFICPSLIGTQEYSFLSGGSVNKPAQHLFVFDPELGLVSMERMYGESQKGPGGSYILPTDATQKAAA